jgi:hypothetical protein
VEAILQDKQRGNDNRTQRWTRIERADLFAQYGDRSAQHVSPRQAAKVLDVPRRTLQAWRAYQESRDACPAVVVWPKYSNSSSHRRLRLYHHLRFDLSSAFL